MTVSSGIIKKFLVVWKRTQYQKLSSGLMLVTFITTYIFQFGFADTEQYWQPSWLFTLTFLRFNSKHIPLAPDCRVLKNPVWCGFTSIQKLSSGLMLLTCRTTRNPILLGPGENRPICLSKYQGSAI